MAQRAQIKCINKNPREDRYHSITHVGGFGSGQWKITKEDAIEKIERREWEFYTIGTNGHQTDVIVAERSGRKYLKTKADYDTPDNLLKLPECP